MRSEDAIDKVRKLEAIATNSGATPGERAAARRQAERISLRYGLEVPGREQPPSKIEAPVVNTWKPRWYPPPGFKPPRIHPLYIPPPHLRHLFWGQ